MPAMATSSITANFTIDDPKDIRKFVNMLCSGRPSKPIRSTMRFRHETGRKAIRDFFAGKESVR